LPSSLELKSLYSVLLLEGKWNRTKIDYCLLFTVY
jgi:hypothetical protein